jgi:hypothetical protein
MDTCDATTSPVPCPSLEVLEHQITELAAHIHAAKKPKTKDFQAVLLGTHSALVSVTWEQCREDDSIERTWRHSYNAVSTDAGWKILVSTFQAGA